MSGRLISSITRSRYRRRLRACFSRSAFRKSIFGAFLMSTMVDSCIKKLFPPATDCLAFWPESGQSNHIRKTGGGRRPVVCSRRPPLVFSQWIIERDAMLFPGPPADFLLQWQLPEFCSIVQRPWRPEGFVKSVRCDRLLLIKSQGKALDSVVKASSSFALLYWSEPM